MSLDAKVSPNVLYSSLSIHANAECFCHSCWFMWLGRLIDL
jgi:hypothetical protein